MDGLLVDSEPLWLEAETAVMARLGANWTPADQVQLLGGSLDRTVRYLLGKARRPASPGQVAEWLMSGIVELARDRGVPVRPGARELLAEVEAAGLPHALVTGSERRFMDVVLACTGLRFDALVCADDVSVTKPDPEPYQLAAKLLGTDPASCYALEDSPNGVASAEAAGSSWSPHWSRSSPRPAGPWSARCSTCAPPRTVSPSAFKAAPQWGWVMAGGDADHDGPFGCAANVARAAAMATRRAILAGAALPFTATVT
jgi:HAD superfamily hydrolase (TIGR01509 family)